MSASPIVAAAKNEAPPELRSVYECAIHGRDPGAIFMSLGRRRSHSLFVTIVIGTAIIAGVVELIGDTGHALEGHPGAMPRLTVELLFLAVAAVFLLIPYRLFVNFRHRKEVGFVVSKDWIIEAAWAFNKLRLTAAPVASLQRVVVKELHFAFKRKHNEWRYTLEIQGPDGFELDLNTRVVKHQPFMKAVALLSESLAARRPTVYEEWRVEGGPHEDRRLLAGAALKMMPRGWQYLEGALPEA